MTNEGTLFDLVSDKKFRDMLDRDYAEIQKCLESNCPKSAVVMSGSIIECLSIFAITDLSLWPNNNGDTLKADISSLISQLHKSNILSEKTRDLSSVIRYCRNLIHPGRTIRLNKNVDEETAKIAMSLVTLIAREVGSAFVKKYGLTAVQFIEKLKIDPSASNLVKHYLKRMNTKEISRLVIDTIPDQIIKLEENNTGGITSVYINKRIKSLSHAFKLAIMHESVNELFFNSYIEIINNGSEEIIQIYDKYFVGNITIKHLNDDDKAMLLDHWINRIRHKEVIKYKDALECIIDQVDLLMLTRFIFTILLNYDVSTAIKMNNSKELYEFLLTVVPGAQTGGSEFMKAMENMTGKGSYLTMCQKLVDNSTKIPF